MDLQDIRKELDAIDKEMVGLFEKRMDLCREVAYDKAKTGKAVYDKEREQQKIAAVKALASKENQQSVEELFSQMMTLSRRLQYKILAEKGVGTPFPFQMIDSLKLDGARVVYQGIEGAYTQEAALRFFGMDADTYHVKTWEEVMRDVEEGKADYGVLPIENSSAGAVTDNYDLLMKYDNHIVAETFLPVNHSLLGLPDARLEDIQTVYSHPQGLMQCAAYLDGHPEWKKISVENTAIAAKNVLKGGNKSEAAIASETAGRLYGLKTLDSSVNDSKNNTTRFIIVAKDAVYQKKASKVSVCFELPHKSGSLYNMLSHFIYNNVNMVMIESRPIKDRNWEYRFFVDIEGNLSDAAVRNSLHSIAQEASMMKIIGNY